MRYIYIILPSNFSYSLKSNFSGTNFGFAILLSKEVLSKINEVTFFNTLCSIGYSGDPAGTDMLRLYSGGAEIQIYCYTFTTFLFYLNFIPGEELLSEKQVEFKDKCSGTLEDLE